MKPAIRVESLSKQFTLGGAARGYRTLRESLGEGARAAWGRVRSFGRRGGEAANTLWALRDVSFEVQPGEVVGIIGRNGAGKSTLLKVLSRIVEPTSGRAVLRGRLSSLLEVGTGFHPELTGRENIYLNGAILGMTRREITRKFDEIVAFSEIERFLDTPVKRYSSGMYVRLAFAVAAHLEPEVLIVDEVLAVGDLAFQRKCLGRMRVASREGRTVIFVSHNMAAVESLCTRALWLKDGRVNVGGATQDVITRYRSEMAAGERRSGSLLSLSPNDRPNRVIADAQFLDEQGQPTSCIPLGRMFWLRMTFLTQQPIEEPTIGLGIDDSFGQRVMSLHTPRSRVVVELLEGRCHIDCLIRSCPLAPGEYWLKIVLSSRAAVVDMIDQAVTFSVIDAEAFGEGRGFHRGVCVAPSEWTLVGNGCSKSPAARLSEGRPG